MATKFCETCGSTLLDDAKFCNNCGKLTSIDPPPVTSAPPPAPSPAPAAAPVQQAYYQAPTPASVPPQQAYYQAPQQNFYQNPVDTTPLTMWQWVLTMIVMAIPILGIIKIFMWAFGSSANINKKNYARAILIISAIGIVLSIVFSAVIGGIIASIISSSGGSYYYY